MATTIINASAGSGKTYRLAVAYLQALLQPLPDGDRTLPQQVLATTFTRAAASEILERVLCRLSQAVVFEDERETLLEEIGHPELQREDLSQLLSSVCQVLSQLQVGTLDSLFARIVRVMGLDLAFPPAWSVADETLSSELAFEAADQMLRGDDAQISWGRWHRFNQFKSGIAVRQALVNLLENNRFALLGHPAISEDNPALEKPLQLTLEEAAEIDAALQGFDLPQTRMGVPHKAWIGAVAKVRAQLAGEPELIALITGHPFFRLVHEKDSSYARVPVPDSLRTILGPIVARAREDLRRLHEARLPSLAALAERYHQLRQNIAYASGAYRFPEVEAAVLSLPPHLFENDLYFRLDGQIQHLLLDEFQDTSLSQFRFLWPIIEEVRSHGRLFFAVGDVKQSIYGWRGAERQLLNRLRDWLDPQHIDPSITCENLATNFRSSPAVLDAIDRVFANLDGAVCLNPESFTKPDDMNRALVRNRAAASFISGYAKPEAAGPNRFLQGRVRLLVVDPKMREDDAENDQEPVEVETILRAVLQHRQEDPEREIAILCRRRKWIPSILARLQSEHIEASGEGGSAVTDSAAVELVLSMLTWLDHPGHTLARTHVELSGIRSVFGFDGTTEDDALAKSILIGIMRRGLVSVLAAWVKHPDFLRKCSLHDRVRSGQLVELARLWDATGGGRLSHFVERVRSQRLENPISAKVRVMTIHGSKGLEFEAVILADLETRGGPGAGPHFVTTMTTPHAAPQIELLPTRPHAEWLGLEDLHDRHGQSEFEEDLSVLYVALTRAKSFLDVVVPSSDKVRSTLEGILRERWGHSQPGEFLIDARAGQAPAEIPAPRSKMSRDPAVWQRGDGFALPAFVRVPERLAPITPSGQEGEGKVSLGLILQGGNRHALERGTAVHALLSRIEWNDHVPTAEEWMRSIPEREANPEACRVAVREFHPRLRASGDSLAAVFDRSLTLLAWEEDGVVDLEVWRERRFAVVFDQELMNGSFDRVVIGLDASGKRVRARILDFKTDRLATEEEREEKRLHYQPQLDAYASALHRLTGIPASLIETRLVWLGDSEVQKTVVPEKRKESPPVKRPPEVMAQLEIWDWGKPQK